MANLVHHSDFNILPAQLPLSRQIGIPPAPFLGFLRATFGPERTPETSIPCDSKKATVAKKLLGLWAPFRGALNSSSGLSGKVLSFPKVTPGVIAWFSQGKAPWNAKRGRQSAGGIPSTTPGRWASRSCAATAPPSRIRVDPRYKETPTFPQLRRTHWLYQAFLKIGAGIDS